MSPLLVCIILSIGLSHDLDTNVTFDAQSHMQHKFRMEVLKD